MAAILTIIKLFAVNPRATEFGGEWGHATHGAKARKEQKVLCSLWLNGYSNHKQQWLIFPFHTVHVYEPVLWGSLCSARLVTSEITPHQCNHLLPFKEDKFGAVWVLDGSNSNSQTSTQQTAELNSCHSTRNLPREQKPPCGLRPRCILSTSCNEDASSRACASH